MRLTVLFIGLAAICSTAWASDRGTDQHPSTHVCACQAGWLVPATASATPIQVQPYAVGDPTPISHAKTPSQLRAAVLYSDREFSTFRHPSIGSQGAISETAARRAPLDRQTEDVWIAVDKAQHLSFSFLWTLGTQYVVVNKGRISEHRALPISITSSALIGVTKEVYDLRAGPPHVFSYKDLVANAVGIVLAAGLILL